MGVRLAVVHVFYTSAPPLFHLSFVASVNGDSLILHEALKLKKIKHSKSERFIAATATISIN